MLTHLISLTTPQAGTVVISEADLAEGELTCPRAHGGGWGSQDWSLGLILGVTLCSRKLCCLSHSPPWGDEGLSLDPVLGTPEAS